MMRMPKDLHPGSTTPISCERSLYSSKKKTIRGWNEDEGDRETVS